MKKSPVLYIFVNKALGMSAGKIAAQVAHAVMMIDVDPDEHEQWKNCPQKTVLIMEARDQAHIINIRQYLKQRDILTRYVIDEGVNEIDPHVITALSTVILDRNDDDQMRTMSTFKLYRDTVRVVMEFDR